MQFKTKHTPLTLLLPILTHSPRGNLLIYSSSFCLVSKYFLKTVIIKLTIKIIRVISIDAEKAFDKIQHPFMIKKKNSQQSGPRGNIPQRNKGHIWQPMGLPQWLSGKEATCNAGDTGGAGSIPESGRSLGGGVNGKPLQYSCLKHPMVRGVWQAAVQRVTKSQTRLINWVQWQTHS